MVNFSEICVHHHVLAKHAMCEQQNIPRTPPLSTWFRDSSLYTLIRRSGAQAVTGGYPLVICYIANWKDPPFLMGKSTMSMAIFNSYVKLPEGKVVEPFQSWGHVCSPRPSISTISGPIWHRNWIPFRGFLVASLIH